MRFCSNVAGSKESFYVLFFINPEVSLYALYERENAPVIPIIGPTLLELKKIPTANRTTPMNPISTKIIGLRSITLHLT